MRLAVVHGRRARHATSRPCGHSCFGSWTARRPALCSGPRWRITASAWPTTSAVPASIRRTTPSSQAAWRSSGDSLRARVRGVGSLGRKGTRQPQGERRLGRLTAGQGDHYDLAWSPDGDQLAFSCCNETEQDISVVAADGTDRERRARNAGLPSSSPDGQLIAFLSIRDGDAEIYVMQADGSEQRRPALPPSRTAAHQASPSPRPSRCAGVTKTCASRSNDGSGWHRSAARCQPSRRATCGTCALPAGSSYPRRPVPSA